MTYAVSIVETTGQSDSFLTLCPVVPPGTCGIYNWMCSCLERYNSMATGFGSRGSRGSKGLGSSGLSESLRTTVDISTGDLAQYLDKIEEDQGVVLVVLQSEGSTLAIIGTYWRDSVWHHGSDVAFWFNVSQRFRCTAILT